LGTDTILLWGSVPGTIVAAGTIVSWINEGVAKYRSRPPRPARVGAARVSPQAPPNPVQSAALPGAGWINFFFSFKGRISRGRMWLFLALYLAIVITEGIVATKVGNPPDQSPPPVLMSLQILLSFLSFYAGLAIAAKRLHDRNKSAHWLWLFAGVSSIMIIVATAANDSGKEPGLAVIAVLSATVIVIWAFVQLYVLRGTAGGNRFGPDPLAS
jgi:uncharacterized membrane protein YhaH (DUF805 family)